MKMKLSYKNELYKSILYKILIFLLKNEFLVNIDKMKNEKEFYKYQKLYYIEIKIKNQNKINSKLIL